jgi:GNAT superfamily N-acetyltransferase
MTRSAGEWIELSPGDAAPAVETDRVDLIDAGERARHAPDRTLLLAASGTLVARCSCWWSDTPVLDGRRIGAIGHYAAADAEAGRALLARACRVLGDAGASIAVGPMDGNTWRRYRFVVEQGSEPPFFLEPQNPADWPLHWVANGFAPLATYTSALVGDLAVDDPRTADLDRRVAAAAVTIRPIELTRTEQELDRVFALSLEAFAGNYLYTPIARGEFLLQYRAVLPFVRQELVFMAERGGSLVGFLFAMPDLLEAGRGVPGRTAILKTLAVSPAVRGLGLGTLLLGRAQRAARELGFTRAIHALMHDDNVSKRMSDRSARTFRRYALLGKLVP